jgi:hypothetical protein
MTWSRFNLPSKDLRIIGCRRTISATPRGIAINRRIATATMEIAGPASGVKEPRRICLAKRARLVRGCRTGAQPNREVGAVHLCYAENRHDLLRVPTNSFRGAPGSKDSTATRRSASRFCMVTLPAISYSGLIRKSARHLPYEPRDFCPFYARFWPRGRLSPANSYTKAEAAVRCLQS